MTWVSLISGVIRSKKCPQKLSPFVFWINKYKRQPHKALDLRQPIHCEADEKQNM